MYDYIKRSTFLFFPYLFQMLSRHKKRTGKLSVGDLIPLT